MSQPGESRFQRILAHVWMIVVLAPTIAFSLAGVESWPWSPCSMFARYRHPGETWWRFSLRARGDGEDFKPIDLTAQGLRPTILWRHFFLHVYGSTDPHLPQGSFPDDTPAAFIARVGPWFSGIVTHAQQRHMPGSEKWSGLCLDLIEVAPDGSQRPPRTIGIYDIKSGEYRMVAQ